MLTEEEEGVCRQGNAVKEGKKAQGQHNEKTRRTME